MNRRIHYSICNHLSRNQNARSFMTVDSRKLKTNNSQADKLSCPCLGHLLIKVFGYAVCLFVMNREKCKGHRICVQVLISIKATVSGKPVGTDCSLGHPLVNGLL